MDPWKCKTVTLEIKDKSESPIPIKISLSPYASTFGTMIDINFEEVKIITIETPILAHNRHKWQEPLLDRLEDLK